MPRSSSGLTAALSRLDLRGTLGRACFPTGERQRVRVMGVLGPEFEEGVIAMVLALGRRLGMLCASVFGRRVLLVGAALVCGAGGAAAQSGRSSALTAHLYWTANLGGGLGTIGEANLNGTDAKTIISGQKLPLGVAVGNGHLYWANAQSGTIVEANVNGTGATTIATGQDSERNVAVGGLHLYWTDYGRATEPRPGHFHFHAGTVVEANLNGTDARTIATGQHNPWGVAVGVGHLYWSDDHAGTITEANLDGTDAKTIATGQSLPTGVAVDRSHLYWADFRSGKIVEANLNGTGAKTIAKNQEYPHGIAVGGGHLYWTTAGEHSAIVEANLNGTDAKTIVRGSSVPLPWALAVGP
jgi:hypothetical protein